MKGAAGPALACGLIAAVLALATAAQPVGMATATGTIFCAFCVAVIAQHGFSHGRRHLFSPVVLITSYMLLGFGVRGLASVWGAGNKLEGVVDPTSAQFFELYTTMFGYCIAGVVALALGDTIGRHVSRHRNARTNLRGTLTPTRAVWVGVGFGALGAAVLIAKLGSRLLTDPAYVATSGTAGLFWVYPLLSAPMFGFTFRLAAAYARSEPTPRWAIAGALASGMAVYILTSSKSAILDAVILLLVTRHILIRPIKLRWLVLAGLGFTMALPVFYLHRSVGLTAELFTRLDAQAMSSGFTILFNRSYLADAFAAVLHYTPLPYGYQLGHNWLEMFYFWVPRALWLNKPISSSVTFADTYLSSIGESHGSFYSTSILGDTYQNFGPVGVPVVMFAVGILLRIWYDRTTSSATIGRVLMYGASVYWIAMAPEQTVQGTVELAVSYVAIAYLIARVGVSRRLADNATTRPPVRPTTAEASTPTTG